MADDLAVRGLDGEHVLSGRGEAVGERQVEVPLGLLVCALSSEKPPFSTMSAAYALRREAPPVGVLVVARADGSARSYPRQPPSARWTSAASRVSVAGSVDGEHAVPEVEDVPGAAAGPIEHVERLGLDDLPRREEDGGVEVPLHGAVRDLRPALVERDPPVEPDHVAARRTAISSRSVAVPVPKWIVGTSTAREDPRPNAARRARDSARA